MHFIYLSVIFSLCSFWEIDLNRHLYRPNEHLARIRKVLIPQGRSMLPVSLLALVQQPQRQVFSRCGVSSVWKLHSCTIRKVKQNKTFMLSLSFFTWRYWLCFHLISMVAAAFLNAKNQGTETIKDISESQVSFNSWAPRWASPLLTADAWRAAIWPNCHRLPLQWSSTSNYVPYFRCLLGVTYIVHQMCGFLPVE